MKYYLSLSVHDLVDFLLRTGDIDNRIYNSDTMAEGTRLHGIYQKRQGSHYMSEYPLFETFTGENYEIKLEGRADGIIWNDEGYVVDEIKSTIVPLEEFYRSQQEWHMGQAKCYALMFAHEKGLDHIGVRLTYIHQLDKTELVKEFSFTTKELEHDVELLFKEYISFYAFIFERIEKRNESVKTLKFPFQEFREGQRELSKYCYAVADKGGILFSEAPTGIGKTVSTLYPFVKSFEKAENEKIFYLTAKNSGKEMAFDTVNLLIKNGLTATPIVISAKDKICFSTGKACNPDECPFAKDYYTKIKKVLTESLKNNVTFSPKTISEIAAHYAICPFEFSLDLSLFCDIIICDYNYFFDPIVYLKRYFDGEYSNKLVLVDEAHNLVDRGRNMYSATISYYLYKQVQHSLSGLDHKKIKNAIKRLSKFFNTIKELPDGDTIIHRIDQTHLNGFEAFLLAAQDVSKHHHEFVTEEFEEFCMDLNKFMKLYPYIDESFVLYVSKNGPKSIKVCFYCLDPSKQLRNSLDKVKAKAIFSATLSPDQYYINCLGGDKTNAFLKLKSPFEPSNLHIMIAPKVSIKYKDRDKTLEEVSEYLLSMINGKMGNYFIYVPSYEYLQKLAPFLVNQKFDLLVQSKDMSDDQKQLFLSAFRDNPTNTTVGLAVVGGAFGEGIDLVSERLIGVAVVGVGMPQICFERNLIKDYYNKTNGQGYHFAYVYPGMNKVMQAVGRVIRGENDRGVALLIDDRYLTATYLDLFKKEWKHYEVVTSSDDVTKEVKKFWENNK